MSKKNRKQKTDDEDEMNTGADASTGSDDADEADEKPKRGKKNRKAKDEDEEPAKPARAKFKVTATRLGYYEHERKYPGTQFWLETEIDEDDKPVKLPSWVVLSKDYVNPDEEVGSEKKPGKNSPDFVKI